MMIARVLWALHAALTAVLLICAFSSELPVDRHTPGDLATVRTLLEHGHYEKAETAARRLLPAGIEAPDAIDDLRAADLLVEALVMNGRGASQETRAIAERIVGRRAAFPGGDRNLATSLRNLGDVLFESGDYPAAIARYREALQVRERSLQVAAVDTAEDLDHLARALTFAGDYDEAAALCERALGLRQQAAATDVAGRARSLQVRGHLRQRTGDYAGALSDFEQAAAILEQRSPAHPQTAEALAMLGEQLVASGDPLRAEDVLIRAVSVATAALRPDHPTIASALRSRAIALQELGDLAASRDVRQRALVIAEGAFGPDHPKVAIQLNDLANTLLLQGEYARARSLYERARAAYEHRLGADHFYVSGASYNLALLHVALGDFAEARRGLLDVLAAWERSLGPENPNIARVASALASLHAEHGFDEAARPYFERALAIRERQLGREHPYVAITLSEWAASLARSRQLDRAYQLSRRALEIWEAAGARDLLANGLVQHAGIQIRRGELADARLSYERALDLRTALLGPSHPSIAEAEAGLAAVQVQLGGRDEAFERALRADEIGRNHAQLTLSALSERQALEYASGRPRGLDIALAVLPDNLEGRRRAFDALIRGRALTLDEIASRHRVRETNQADQAPLWAALTSARQRLANLVIRGPNLMRPDQYATLVDEARREKEAAERALAEQSVVFRSELARADVGLRQVAAALPPASALVSYLRFDRTVPGDRNRPLVATYAAFVWRSDAAAPEFLTLGRASAIDLRIQRWRRELVAGITSSSVSGTSAERTLHPAGVRLRRTLWDPIAAHLEGVSRVFVVTDDAISLVPFAALPGVSSPYLLEDGPVVHYLSAERDLAVRPADRDAGRGLLAVGGAAFGDETLFSSGGSARVETNEPPAGAIQPGRRRADANCPTFQSMRFRALPGTVAEAEDLRRLWSELGDRAPEIHGSARALTGPGATERAVKQLATGKRILHLATHGFFLGSECAPALDGSRAVGGLAVSGRDKPSRAPPPPGPTLNPLLLTGLAFAGANRRAVAGPDDEDGILTAEEVASLDLRGLEWAVLSACDTGLGEIRVGEGVFGLRRAFQIAGARTVIMSLWSVDDQATRAWMRALYEGRLSRKLSTADAVRHASLTVLRDRRARGRSTHPFYWAAFVAAGDWR